MFGWFKEISKGEKRTFWACFGGWALDALDVQMFSLVIPTIIAAWHQKITLRFSKRSAIAPA